MGLIKKLEKLTKYGEPIVSLFMVIRDLDKYRQNIGSDRQCICRKFKREFGYCPDLDNPQTLNEKIQWLKINVHKDIQTVCADKYAVREWLIEKFGEEIKEYLIPLYFATSDWREITYDKLPDEPFIIKSNHGCHQYAIVRDKSKIDIRQLRIKCKLWLSTDPYIDSQEWQYKNIPRKIVVEKLLQTSDGKIPNDYKLEYFNGQLQFVYCSIGRESENKRNIYDPQWNPLPFSWVSKGNNQAEPKGDDIPAPASYESMKKYGDAIARLFDYVRCDFYDLEGHLYFGEITFHHGGGYNHFIPNDYDLYWGKRLTLTSYASN